MNTEIQQALQKLQSQIDNLVANGIFGPVIGPQTSDILKRNVAIPYTTIAPSFVPSYQGYSIVYNDGTNYWLYIYQNSVWKKVQLS